MRKTKILVKIADNRSEVPFIKSLFDAGANVAWLNTAHQDEAATEKVIANIRSVSKYIPIAIDTKGPEVRIRDVETPLEVKKGDKVILTGDVSLKGANVIHVSYPNFHNEVPVGEVVLYDDAQIELTVERQVDRGIECVIGNPGLIKNKKSLNVPNVHIKLPALSDKDKSFIHFCAKHDIDFITHSFVRSADDIAEIKKITDTYPEYRPKIIAKIENKEGFKNVRDILEHCDGLMVARGDLGAEVGLENVPYMQMEMVDATLEMGKYCIVATQALESMIKNPRPTRAEVSDVANAVLEGTGAMSMSGETAYGDYPVEATRMMARVMKATEENCAHMFEHPKLGGFSAVARTARKAARKSRKDGVAAIITLHCGIELNRALSALRPTVPVIAGCAEESNARELAMAYAVHPVHTPDESSCKRLIEESKNRFQDADKLLIIERVKKSFKISTQSFGEGK